MMSWKEVASLTDLKDKQRLVVDVDGRKVLLLMRHEKVHAVDAKCPHLGLPLTKADINENEEIICPFHKSAFDLCSGEVKCWAPWPKIFSGVMNKLSKPKSLTVFSLKIDDDKVLLQV